MGEIGYNKDEFLHVLKFWEIRSIIKGYRNRSHTQWESVRLGAYLVMSSMSDLRKAGICRDTDLVKFAWERSTPSTNQPSMEEIESLRELMRQENARLEKENSDG